MPRVEAVCRSGRRGVPKSACGEVLFVADHGLDADAHAGPGHRQVSLLAAEEIERFEARGMPGLPPGAFGENVVVSGLDLANAGLGSRIALGREVQLSVTQLGKVCHTRCAIYERAGDCIMPRVGLFARVLAGGRVAPGDAAAIAHPVPRELFQVVLLTISDRCSRGEARDTAGPATAAALRAALPCHVYREEILPDERATIAERLRHYCDGHTIDLVVTVGGTGFSPRDVTPEAVADAVDRCTPGLDEAMRAASLRRNPHAMLSRGVSGIRGATLVLSLPGSERAALENVAVVLPGLAHGLSKLRGDAASCADGAGGAIPGSTIGP